MGMIGYRGRNPFAGDMTNQYNTQLSPQQEAAFQQWRSALPPNLQSTQDYDLRAAYLRNAQEAGNGHLDDVGKKPNHMTFSEGSIYSTPQTPGGVWSQSAPPSARAPEGQWNFEASPTNLRAHTADDILNYFQAYEQNKQYLPDGSFRYGAPNTVTLPPNPFGRKGRAR